jgi:hypothetical protein
MWNKSYWNKHCFIGSYWPDGLIKRIRHLVFKSSFTSEAEFNDPFDSVAEFSARLQ